MNYYCDLANNCVKTLLLIRHVRFSTLGGFAKGLFLVLHPNIAVLRLIMCFVLHLNIAVESIEYCDVGE